MFFLKCVVVQSQEPFHKHTFIYGLHCLKRGSTSLFQYHKDDDGFDLSEGSVERHMSRFSQYVEDIQTEVDLLYDSGKLFKELSRHCRLVREKQQPRTFPQTVVEPTQHRCERHPPLSLWDFDDHGESQEGEVCDEGGIFNRTIESAVFFIMLPKFFIMLPKSLPRQ